VKKKENFGGEKARGAVGGKTGGENKVFNGKMDSVSKRAGSNILQKKKKSMKERKEVTNPKMGKQKKKRQKWGRVKKNPGKTLKPVLQKQKGSLFFGRRKKGNCRGEGGSGDAEGGSRRKDTVSGNRIARGDQHEWKKKLGGGKLPGREGNRPGTHENKGDMDGD